MKKAVLALAAVLALVLTASALGEGDDFSQGKGVKAAPNWKLLGLGSSGRTWTSKPATAFADGIGFAFSTTPTDTRLFLTSHPGSGLLGDLTGKTLTATFTITGTATAFTYPEGGPPMNACPTPASVRLYFEGNTTLENYHQWWSNPQAYTLTSLVGHTLTLTVPLDRANWSDKNDDDFAAAVANVGAVGVSFGGGCFLPTGVAPTDGTASFVLKSYSVS
jgi:hypothetical protein